MERTLFATPLPLRINSLAMLLLFGYTGAVVPMTVPGCAAAVGAAVSSFCVPFSLPNSGAFWCCFRHKPRIHLSIFSLGSHNHMHSVTVLGGIDI